MRPNLSLEHIAATLAVLGTSILAGCGGSEPAAQTPVQSVEVATPAPAAVSVGVAAPAAPAMPATPSLGVAAGATGTVAPMTATVATPAVPATPVAASVTVGTKPKAPATPAKKKGGNGQASCGAGTCSASK